MLEQLHVDCLQAFLRSRHKKTAFSKRKDGFSFLCEVFLTPLMPLNKERGFSNYPIKYPFSAETLSAIFVFNATTFGWFAYLVKRFNPISIMRCSSPSAKETIASLALVVTISTAL